MSDFSPSIFSGTGPLRWLRLRSNLRRGRQVPRVGGIGPVRRFWPKSSMLKAGNFKPGMGPVNLLPLKSSDLKPVIRFKDNGIEPLRWLL